MANSIAKRFDNCLLSSVFRLLKKRFLPSILNPQSSILYKSHGFFTKTKKCLISTTLLLLRGYQLFISPWLGSRCRFYPSCSEYTKEAISTFGMMKGSLLSAKRLLRCHPFCEGGFDPVPSVKQPEDGLCPNASHPTIMKSQIL